MRLRMNMNSRLREGEAWRGCCLDEDLCTYRLDRLSDYSPEWSRIVPAADVRPRLNRPGVQSVRD